VKNICITGASAGIGAACADILARQGHQLILGARRLDRLKTMQAKLEKLGSPRVLVQTLDVEEPHSVATFAKATLEFCNGQLDVLVNNAGLAQGAEHVQDGNVSHWQKMLDVNVMGVLHTTRAFLESMVARGSGQIVFMSSIAAHQVYEGGAVYAATKHAVRAIAQTLKLELNGKAIRINTIDPGMVNTEFSKVRYFGDQARADKVYQGLTPLTAEDIAECVAFVISRPAHVNIDELIVMPTDQATVYRAFRR